jgi:choline dehydrogenase-like flavoprotein
MKIVVVGSGVSGAHAALTLLERGCEVEMWDVGRDDMAAAHAGVTFHDLKSRLADPVAHFLGGDHAALVPPAVPELLRYPPSRRFLAAPDDALWDFVSDSFHPHGSFAKGGLANGWGANALAYDQNDLAGWPVSFTDMDAAYRTVCRRIPVAGPAEDDLSPHLNGIYPSQPPVRLSSADQRLLRMYERRKRSLAKSGVLIGAARLAVTTDPSRTDACDYCDRCLWGCPRASIYNPRVSTLEECAAHRGFRYVSGRLVLSLLSRDNLVTGIRYFDTAGKEIREEPCDVAFLAAGALQTGAIFLRTIKSACPEIGVESAGLMDTAVVKIPFLALRCVGQPIDQRAFQFNRLIVGMVGNGPSWPNYLHGELLHLTSLIYHPLIERMPFDSRFSKRLFFALKSALGVATLFFPDRIAAGNSQVLVERGERWEMVGLQYRETGDKERYIRHSISRMRSVLWRLGCVPRGAVRSPSGAGIHYAGTVPMGDGPKRCDAQGRSNLFSNLYIADGAAFPSLPSKAITMSLAAHATRVALGAQV